MNILLDILHEQDFNFLDRYMLLYCLQFYLASGTIIYTLRQETGYEGPLNSNDFESLIVCKRMINNNLNGIDDRIRDQVCFDTKYYAMLIGHCSRWNMLPFVDPLEVASFIISKHANLSHVSIVDYVPQILHLIFSMFFSCYKKCKINPIVMEKSFNSWCAFSSVCNCDENQYFISILALNLFLFFFFVVVVVVVVVMCLSVVYVCVWYLFRNIV